MQKFYALLATFLSVFVLNIASAPAPAHAKELESPTDAVVAIGPNNSGLVLSWKVDESRTYTSTTVTKIDGSLDGIQWTRLATQPWWKTTLSVSKLADSWKYFSIAIADGWDESDWTDSIDSSVHRKFFTTAQSLQKRSFKAQVVPNGFLFGWTEYEDQVGLEAPINTPQYVQIVVKRGKTSLTYNGLASPNMAFLKAKIIPNERLSGVATFVYRNGYVEKVNLNLSTPKITPKFLTTKVDLYLIQYDKVRDKIVDVHAGAGQVTIAIQTLLSEPLFTCSVELVSGTFTTKLDSHGAGSLTFPPSELSAATGFNDVPIQCNSPRASGKTFITFTTAEASCDCWPQSSFLAFTIPKT